MHAPMHRHIRPTNQSEKKYMTLLEILSYHSWQKHTTKIQKEISGV